MDTKLMDKRVIERNLNRGLISEKELTKHLKGLPDVEDQGEELILDSEEAEAEEEVPAAD